MHIHVDPYGIYIYLNRGELLWIYRSIYASETSRSPSFRLSAKKFRASFTFLLAAFSREAIFSQIAVPISEVMPLKSFKEKKTRYTHTEHTYIYS